MNRRLSGLILFVVAGGLTGQVIPGPEARVAVIEKIERALQVEDLSSADLIASPFREEAEVAEPKLESEDAPPAELTAAEALAIVSESFRPTGTLVKGGRAYLLTATGDRIPEGGVFEARLSGRVYRIEVSSISDKEYQLRLEDVVMDRVIDVGN